MDPQSLKEEYLLSGYLESTKQPYAIAKIVDIKCAIVIVRNTVLISLHLCLQICILQMTITRPKILTCSLL